MPVDVDAVLFWKVIDPKKAALDVADYSSAINWASQTALRDVIGKTMLSDMLEGREKISDELQKIIDVRTEPWGINVISVEVKDVLIPPALEDAMSMQAQAERERQARVILGDSERQVAEKFGEAAKTYANNPIAFHLRAMNMLYEGLEAERHDRHRAEHGRRNHAARRAGRDNSADHGTWPRTRGHSEGSRVRQLVPLGPWRDSHPISSRTRRAWNSSAKVGARPSATRAASGHVEPWNCQRELLPAR